MSDDEPLNAEVVEAEYDPDANRLEYVLEAENGDRAELTFSGKVGLHTALSEEAMRELADELPGTEYAGDVHEMFAEAIPETSVGFDTGVPWGEDHAE